MRAAPARLHPTVSTLRFDRRRLQITRSPPVTGSLSVPPAAVAASGGDRLRRGRRLGRTGEINTLKVLLTAEG